MSDKKKQEIIREITWSFKFVVDDMEKPILSNPNATVKIIICGSKLDSGTD